MADADELLEAMAHYQLRPVDFVREVIGVEPDDWQADAMRDLVEHRLVSIAACHGVGKDALASWLVLWALCCFYEVKSPCTAPTSTQLHDLLWAEVAKWRARMLPWFAAQLRLTDDRIVRVDAPDQAFASARTARRENPEALQGFHSDVVLVVVDEASGVPDVIFEVLQGALTGDRSAGKLTMCLCIGNPTQLSGFFHRTHHDPVLMAKWRRYRVLASDAHDGGPLPRGTYTSARPGPEYVETMAAYGRESNTFRVRVLGLFPRSGDDQVVHFEWLELAKVRELPEGWLAAHHVVMGVDIARKGNNDSAIAIRQGPRPVGFATWNGHDLVDSAGKIVAAARVLAARGEKPAFIFVDGVGVGAGVVDMLQKNEELRANGVRVIEILAGASSPDPECNRLRDALWWRARRAFDPKDAVLEAPLLAVAPEKQAFVDRLTAELGAPKFGYTPSQKVAVERKDQLEARGVRSPDLADAWVMTYAFEAGLPPPPPEKDYILSRKGTKAPGSGWVMP